MKKQFNKLTNLLNLLWINNTFFWKMSKLYISPWKFKDYLYAPIAWIKFMKLSINI